MGLDATKPLFGFPTKAVSKQYPQLQRLAVNCNFTCRMFTFDTFQKANNKSTDQTALICRLVCACVVRKPQKTGFLASRPICCWYSKHIVIVLIGKKTITILHSKRFLTLCIWETPKQVLLQTVKTQMKCRIIRVYTVCIDKRSSDKKFNFF